MYAIASSTTESRSSERLPERGWRAWLAHLRNEEGSNLIEFAFIGMFMIGLVAGTVDMGGAFQRYMILVNASREGARAYSKLPCKSDNRTGLKNAIVSAVVQEAAGTNVLITVGEVTLSPNPSGGCPADGAPIRVTVRHNYTTILGQLVGFSNLPIQASTSMVFYGNDGAQGGK